MHPVVARITRNLGKSLNSQEKMILTCLLARPKSVGVMMLRANL